MTRLNGIYETNVKASGITYMKGMASFVGPKSVKVSAEIFESEHILIASGGRPEDGAFPGAEFCMNSNDFFDLESIPDTCVVIGGGYIGIELAQILNGFGCKVTLVVRSVPLRFVDDDVVDVLMKELEHSGVDVRLGSPHESVSREENGHLSVNLKSGDSIKAEKVLVAMGRPPCTSDLGLEHTKVQTSGGYVTVDPYQNTHQPGVYALGDVTKAPALTPVAVRAGRILSERLFNGKTDLKADYENVPTVIFSHPTIGTCGLSEQAARKQFGSDSVKAYKSEFVNMFYGLMDPKGHRPKSLFKIITNKEKEGEKEVERVVGVHTIGRGTDEMMQTVAVAMKMRATKQDFDNAVALHPTASEELVLMDTKYV